MVAPLFRLHEVHHLRRQRLVRRNRRGFRFRRVHRRLCGRIVRAPALVFARSPIPHNERT